MTARVLDLSPGGAHIETASALRVGAPYAFTLELSGTSRRLHGRVRWCRLVATRAVPSGDRASGDPASGDRSPVYRAGIVWNEELPPASATEPEPGS